jgi:hypothetical protein
VRLKGRVSRGTAGGEVTARTGPADAVAATAVAGARGLVMVVSLTPAPTVPREAGRRGGRGCGDRVRARSRGRRWWVAAGTAGSVGRRSCACAGVMAGPEGWRLDAVGVLPLAVGHVVRQVCERGAREEEAENCCVLHDVWSFYCLFLISESNVARSVFMLVELLCCMNMYSS